MRAIALSLLTLLIAAPVVAGEGDALFKEAMAQVRDGRDTKADYEEAIRKFDAAIVAGLSKEDEARAHAWKGMALLYRGDLEPSVDKMLPWYKKGEASAKKGVAVDGRCADCFYIASACLGRWSQRRGVMNSLFTVKEVLAGFDKTLAIDPNHADALLAHARADEALPFFAGGSIERAEQRFKKVLSKQPHHTRAMMDYAEMLAREDREDEARKWANKALAEKSPRYPGEHRKWDKARAKRLLAKLDE